MVRDGGRDDRLRPLHRQRRRRDPSALAAQSQARRDQGLLGLALRSLPSRGRAHGAVRRPEAVAGDGERALHARAARTKRLAAVEKRTAIKAIITPNPVVGRVGNRTALDDAELTPSTHFEPCSHVHASPYDSRWPPRWQRDVHHLSLLPHRPRREPLPADVSRRPAARVRPEEGAAVGDLHALRALEPHAARGTLGSDRRI